MQSVYVSCSYQKKTFGSTHVPCSKISRFWEILGYNQKSVNFDKVMPLKVVQDLDQQSLKELLLNVLNTAFSSQGSILPLADVADRCMVRLSLRTETTNINSSRNCVIDIDGNYFRNQK